MSSLVVKVVFYPHETTTRELIPKHGHFLKTAMFRYELSSSSFVRVKHIFTNKKHIPKDDFFFLSQFLMLN